MWGFWIGGFGVTETLTNRNARRSREIAENERSKTLAGVLCDTCYADMVKPEPLVTLTVDPPRMRVKCPNCGAEGTMIE